MAEVWPQVLNYALDRGSFSLDPHPDLNRTEFDDGPQLVRVRFSNPISVYNGTITFTNEEFEIFRGFYTHRLNQGSKWFEFPVWTGSEYTIHKARFAKKYEIKDEGWNQYTLGISLEVRAYFTFGSFASYIFGLFGKDFVIGQIADPLQIIVNVTYPNIFKGNVLAWDTDTEFSVVFTWDQEDGTETDLIFDTTFTVIPFLLTDIDEELGASLLVTLDDDSEAELEYTR